LGKKAFFTGEGPCPVCGKQVVASDPRTHHSHEMDKNGNVSSKKLGFFSTDKNDPRPTLWDHLTGKLKQRMNR
jgi:hypothetical protein